MRYLPWLLLAPLLTGCPGEMLICGVNWDICEGTLGDDDDDDAERDFANYDGTEILNIDWTQEQEEAGYFDCTAEWRAQGPNTITDDFNLCPSCDEMWTINLIPLPGTEECLIQGTGIPVEPSYTRKVGLRLDDDTNFTLYRTNFGVGNPLGGSPNDPLGEAGVGAFLGADFTFSGVADPRENGALGYSFWYSGEGTF